MEEEFRKNYDRHRGKVVHTQWQQVDKEAQVEGRQFRERN